jgi:competence protein ComEC
MPRFLVISLVSLTVLVSQIWNTWPDEYVHLIFCDVGQGDAILITSGFTQLLIDGGRGDQVLSCLEENLPFFDRNIEVVIATHADADHIGGLDEVLDKYFVSQVFTTRFVKDSSSFFEFKQAIAEEISEGAVLKKPILGQQIGFSQDQEPKKWFAQPVRPLTTFTFLSPQVDQVAMSIENQTKTETNLSDVDDFFDSKLIADQTYNDASIVLFLQIGRIRVLLMGDLELTGELALVDANMLHQIDILKVGHHGSKTSSSADFIEIVRPEISVISVGKNNNFNHPSLEVMNTLMQFDGRVLRTDEQGTIHLTSDGDNYWLTDK